MEFDKSRCYSAINADELRAGDKVIVADNLADLKEFVRKNDVHEIEDILSDCVNERFGVCGMANYALAYLVEREMNCTNCGAEPCGYRANHDSEDNKISKCPLWFKPKTEQKAEAHYRPFRDTDELIKVWNKKFYLDFKPSHDPLTMPYIWVRLKECNKGGLLITYFGEDEVKTDVGFLTMSKLLNAYTFTDGSVCGVEE